MQHQNTLGKVMVLAGLTLGIVLCIRMTSAQRQGGYGQSREYQQQNGVSNQQSGGQSPVVRGTITGGNSKTGTITVQNQSGGSATIQCSNSTQIMTETPTTSSSLKIGDEIQVKGMPATINATSIVDGQLPSSMQASAGQSRGSNRASGTGSGTAFASATGVITSLNPLTISLGGISVTITGSANTSVSRLVPLTFSQLKVGDTVSATGQAGSNGTFAASGVAINMGR